MSDLEKRIEQLEAETSVLQALVFGLSATLNMSGPQGKALTRKAFDVADKMVETAALQIKAEKPEPMRQRLKILEQLRAGCVD
ncbi:hypothetical protein [Rhizorhabdus sp.]|uniref:hypothetical protein n=1 Tax=Rhizorhabdus sp. TaxID=1968843 RepID=UPI00120474C9|nr:hypothetical protein [Rhizorhabdus sp.]MBD3762115.1 hypothetical protein [Rhizorhabdus sp.]TAK10148.1 MAG: hypothetical protein EPO38_08390 [Rhizorhabdus sp.]